jgi:hypothetical protein
MAEIDFTDLKSRAKDLQSSYSERNLLFKEMEEMFFMKWEEEAKVKRTIENVKVTLSPDPRNQLIGAVRLLIASDPVFSMPGELNEPEAQYDSEAIEKFCQRMWQAAGKISGTPIHYEAVLSAFLYGETHIAIINTKDLLDAAGGKGDAYKTRAKLVARRTPYLFEVWNPKDCFTTIDKKWGLTEHYRRTSTTKQEIWSDWGEDANHITGKPYDTVTHCEWWDLENHLVWVEGVDPPILNEKHGLPFIPIEVAITDGSLHLFTKPEEQRQPFLYAIAKSGLWNRQNLSLTVLFTFLHGLGANPMFLYEANEPDKELFIDWSRPGGVATIERGENLAPLAKQIIDPNLWQSFEVTDKLTSESTIYKQTLGEPLGKNAPYSMVALLSQSGRLPLISPQRRLGWMIGSLVEKCLMWLKKDKRKASARYGGSVMELKPSEIPDDFEIEAALDVSLPQDDLINAQVARQLTEGDDPLVSQEYVLKNVLKVEQPSEMQEQIWREQAANLKAQQYFAHQLFLLQQKMELAMRPPGLPEGGGPVAPPGELPPEGGGEVAPPVEGAQPHMVEGGGVPPEKYPNMPPPRGGAV